MFKTKYKRCLDILDSEIKIIQNCYESFLNENNADNIKDPALHDMMILNNLKLMDTYLNKFEALQDLKKRILSEIGM